MRVPKRMVEVRLAVPKLGIVAERYDLNNPSDRETFDLNSQPPRMVLNIKPIEETDA